MEIDRRTKSMAQIFVAKIKVKGKESGFLTAEIDMAIGKERFTIKLKARSRLNMSKRRNENTPLDLDDFDRCTIKLGGEEEGIEKEVEILERSEELQRQDRDNGDSCETSNDDMETRDKNEARNGAVSQSLGEEQLPSNHGLVKVKDIFLKLQQNLTGSGPTGISSLGPVLGIYEKRNSNPKEIEDVMLGKLWVKGLNFFIKGEIRREQEIKVSAQVKAQKKSTPGLRFHQEDIEGEDKLERSEDERKEGAEVNTQLEEIEREDLFITQTNMVELSFSLMMN